MSFVLCDNGGQRANFFVAGFAGNIQYHGTAARTVDWRDWIMGA
jgi:hypothetical protein